MELLDTDWIIQALAKRQPALGTLDRLAGSRVYVSFERVPDLKLYQPS